MTVLVEGIYYSPMASQPMLPLYKANLIKGVGLDGDRYAKRVGTFSVLRSSISNPGEQEPGRQLTLISGDGVRNSVMESGIEWNPNKSIGDLRRNVVLTGISAEELLQWIGCIVQFGGETTGPKLLVHRNCVPCIYNERKNATPGLMEALWNTGGVSCEVLEGGQISVGDSVTIVPPYGKNNDTSTRHPVDAGHRTQGFFIRPSQRTAYMVREELEEKKAMYRTLCEIDPVGVERAQSSYESVGLGFWPKFSR